MKKPSKPKPFGEQLKALREELGLTQVEAAKILGVTSRAISLWEIGTDAKRQPHELTQEGALARLKSLRK